MKFKFKYLIFSSLFLTSVSCLPGHEAQAVVAQTPGIINTQPVKITVKDPQINNLVSQNAKLELLNNHSVWTEGPMAMPDGSVIWSDIKGNKVYHCCENEGTKVWYYPSEHQNGHALDPQKNVVAASHGKRAIEQRDEKGEWHILVDLYGEQKLNSPNDIIVDRSGEIWFTDPDFGIIQPAESYGGNPVQGGNFVYRYNPQTRKLTRLNTSLVKAPNGLAFSPDEKKLYITDTELAYDFKNLSLNHQIDVYDVAPDKTLHNGRVVTPVGPSIPDGIKIDEHGNIWSSSGTGIQIFTSKGKKLGEIVFPQIVSNLSFGINPRTKKPVIFVTSNHNVYRLDVKVKGEVMP